MAGDHSLLDGFDNQMIILLMAPPLVAALCVSVARMLPQRAKTRADYSNMILGSTLHGGIEAVRRFWRCNRESCEVYFCTFHFHCNVARPKFDRGLPIFQKCVA